MQASHRHWLARLLVGTSALSLMGAAQTAMAQEAPVDSGGGDEIVVTGIRASLESAAAIKRDAQGVVDAISSEDIGKFPDTNLAESLQRISGVSSSPPIGQGSRGTVRGVGPEFNMALLNRRQMPSSSIPAKRTDGSTCRKASTAKGMPATIPGRSSSPTPRRRDGQSRVRPGTRRPRPAPTERSASTPPRAKLPTAARHRWSVT